MAIIAIIIKCIALHRPVRRLQLRAAAALGLRAGLCLPADCMDQTTRASNGCSSDYSAVAECANVVQATFPWRCRWCSDVTFGGPQSNDYCAFRAAVCSDVASVGVSDFEDLC